LKQEITEGTEIMATDATDPGDDNESDEPKKCWFCNCEIPSSDLVCNGQKCREYLRELDAEQAAFAWSQYWQAWPAALRERCKPACNNYCLNRWERWFYTLKVFICLAIGRKRHFGWRCTPVEVGTIRSHQDGYGWSATWICVGYGLFRNWGYEITSDGDCFY
jgi:hypothetical protein